ncbi:hypothetical protein [uncultured Thalassolituus sp.]|uniref:hypothetical protein n=1 Tax=uncultured Thalassolituus sp. TaxID=285273 RepID=UPI0026130317|nr:hypothetical protein [uncultured Thalassolituus sp.]
MTKLSLALAFTAVASSACLSGCDHPNSTTPTNPDFNSKSVFTDYGTYGRTIHFYDVEGNEWCYYDLLTMESSEEITLTISAPVQEKCNINTELPLVSYSAKITGENLKEDTISLSTVMTDSSRTNGVYSTDYKYREDTSDSEPLSPFVIFFRADERIMVNVEIETTESGLIANIPFITDYIMAPAGESVAHSTPFPNLFTGNSPEVYEELFNAYGFLDHLRTGDLPYPETEYYLFTLSVENRYNLYRDHPYQKLSPSENDPYPLSQIRIQ